MKHITVHRQWNLWWLWFGAGLDTTEPWWFRFHLEVCLPHRDFNIGLSILCLDIELFVAEP